MSENNINFIDSKISGVRKAENDKISIVYKNVVNDNYRLKTRKIIYGKTWCNGDIIYSFPTNSNTSNVYNFLSILIAFADHEIESFQGMSFDGRFVNFDRSGNPDKGKSKFFPANSDRPFLVLKVHHGRANQEADALMEYLALEWTKKNTMSGISYIHAWLRFHEEVYPGYKLPNIAAIIKGKKVLDFRTNTTSHSYNPALCIYDYLTQEMLISKDKLDLDSFKQAANVCDKEVTFPWSKNKTKSNTYSLSGLIDTAQNPMQVISNMLFSMDGSILFENGKWKIFAGSAITCSYSINDDDLLSDPLISYTKNNYKVNCVKAFFIDSDINYKPASIIVSSSNFLKQDGRKLTKNLDISFVTNKDHVTYLANIALKKSRKKITITFSAKISTLSIPINSGVYITLKNYGWNRKQFKLIKSVFNINGYVDLTLEELDNSIWDLNKLA